MHRIRRQIIELELPREEGAAVLQQRVSSLFRDRIQPRLERLFDELDLPDRTVRIEQLVLDMGELLPAELEQAFTERFLRSIEQQIREQLAQSRAGSGQAVTVSAPERQWETVLFFLKQGYLPWYAGGEAVAEMKAFLTVQLRQHPDSVMSHLWPLLLQSGQAIERLIYQFGPALAMPVIEQGLRLPTGFLENWREKIARKGGKPLSQPLIARLWRQVLVAAESESRHIASWPAPLEAMLEKAWLSLGEQMAVSVRPVAAPEGLPVPGVAQLPDEKAPLSRRSGAPGTDLPIENHPQNAGLPPPAKADAPPANVEKMAVSKSPPTPAPDLKTGITIQNAGLVILHPYLKTMFDRLGWLTGRTFRSEETRWRAAHLLHYLATGLELPDESELVLNKILCGLPLAEPVPREIELLAEEKTEAGDLLQAVLTHWSALKNTSPEGLRNGFLQRTGQLRLSEERGGWLLQVEAQGQDILLHRLPWTISVVKLPWMDSMMTVEWGEIT